MGVDVDQPRHRKGSIEIHHLGVLAGDGLDIGIRADYEELPILDGNRLSPGLDFVDGVDFTFGVKGVGDLASLTSRQ